LKKLKAVVITLLIALMVSSCSAPIQDLQVTFKVPASMFEGQTQNEIMQNAKKHGIEATLNEDGSYTYVMTAEAQEKYLKEIEKLFKEAVDEVLQSDYISFDKVEASSDFKEIRLYTTKTEYSVNLFDGFVFLGLAIPTSLYQTINEVAPEDITMVFQVINSASNKVLYTYTIPDDLKALTNP